LDCQEHGYGYSTLRHIKTLDAMNIKESKKDQVVILDLHGRLDAVSSPLLRDKMNGLIDSGEKYVLVSFSNLEYISSAGLRVLLSALAKVRPNEGKIVLAEPNDLVREVFKLAGFYSIFPIYEEQEKALEDLAHSWKK